MARMKALFTTLRPWTQYLVLRGFDPAPYLAAREAGDWDATLAAHPFRLMDPHLVDLFGDDVYADLAADGMHNEYVTAGFAREAN